MNNNQISSLTFIEINPKRTAQRSIIWLHGLGADGHDFEPIVKELGLPSDYDIRFIFPHAPMMPVTVNQGMTMRAWFDIYEFNISAKIDEAGIAASVSQVKNLIAKEEARGVSASNIILAGFSQGAVIALSAGLCYEKPIAGILALSGYLPHAKQLFQSAPLENQSIPIFVGHGTMDTIVPYALGKTTYTNLKQAGFNANWHSYAMAHSVCPDEVRDIEKWLQSIYQFANSER
jgi:phospholipase/carboxylesterase